MFFLVFACATSQNLFFVMSWCGVVLHLSFLLSEIARKEHFLRCRHWICQWAEQSKSASVILLCVWQQEQVQQDAQVDLHSRLAVFIPDMLQASAGRHFFLHNLVKLPCQIGCIFHA